MPDPDDRPLLSSLSRRTLLGGAAAGAALASLRVAPGFGVQVASGTTATPTLTIDPGARLGRIGARALGFSFEKSTLATPLFQASNTDLVALFRLLGPGVLRLGGNSVDRTDWDPSGAGLAPGVVAPPDLARLRGFLDAVDWQVLYGTPFVSTGASAPTVAHEAHTAAGVLGARLDGVELCNEPDLFAANPAHAALAGTFSLFHSRWNSFAAAVRTATPGIALTGPACCLLQTIGTWTTPFATAESGGLSQLTQHYYRGFGGPGQTIDLLLGPDPLLGSSLADLAAAAGVAGAPAGFRLTETNSFASGGQPGVSNTLASALWAVEHVLRSLEGGAVGLNFHNSGTGAGYPAIVQQGGVVTEIRPLYFGLLLAARLGTGDLVATSRSGPLPSLRSHAVHGGRRHHPRRAGERRPDHRPAAVARAPPHGRQRHGRAAHRRRAGSDHRHPARRVRRGPRRHLRTRLTRGGRRQSGSGGGAGHRRRGECRGGHHHPRTDGQAVDHDHDHLDRSRRQHDHGPDDSRSGSRAGHGRAPLHRVGGQGVTSSDQARRGASLQSRSRS